MEDVHTRWRRNKGWPTKKKASANSANIAKRWANRNEKQKETSATSVDEEVRVSESGPSTSTSTTQRKLDYFTVVDQGTKETAQVPTTSEFYIIHKDFWEDLVKSAVCKTCCQGQLKLHFRENQGFVKKVVATCDACQEIICQTYTSPRVTTDATGSTRPPFITNRKIVDAFLDIGTGVSSFSV